MRSWANLFGRSPFDPMQQHMDKAAACAALVPALFDALLAGEEQEIAKLTASIAELETEADVIKNQLRDHLPRQRLLPVARSDLLEILDLQDSLADVAEDIALLLTKRHWDVPAELHEPIRACVRRAGEVTAAAHEVMRNLDELVEVGFAGPEAENVLKMINEVNALEDESDALRHSAIAAVFEHETNLSPVDVLLWLKLIDRVGDLTDFAKKVVNRLRLFVAK